MLAEHRQKYFSVSVSLDSLPSLAGFGHPVKKMSFFWRLVELKDPTVLNSKL